MILIIIEEYNNGIISINGRTKYKLYNNATTVFDVSTFVNNNINNSSTKIIDPNLEIIRR